MAAKVLSLHITTVVVATVTPHFKSNSKHKGRSNRETGHTALQCSHLHPVNGEKAAPSQIISKHMYMSNSNCQGCDTQPLPASCSQGFMCKGLSPPSRQRTLHRKLAFSYGELLEGCCVIMIQGVFTCTQQR